MASVEINNMSYFNLIALFFLGITMIIQGNWSIPFITALMAFGIGIYISILEKRHERELHLRILEEEYLHGNRTNKRNKAHRGH